MCYFQCYFGTFKRPLNNKQKQQNGNFFPKLLSITAREIFEYKRPHSRIAGLKSHRCSHLLFESAPGGMLPRMARNDIETIAALAQIPSKRSTHHTTLVQSFLLLRVWGLESRIPLSYAKPYRSGGCRRRRCTDKTWSSNRH